MYSRWTCHWDSSEAQVGSKIAAALPERGRMEIPSPVTGQLAKINVHRAAESVPTRKSLLLHALEIPEGIADILKIEVHPTPRKTRPRSAPVSEEMAAQEATEPNAISPIELS